MKSMSDILAAHPLLEGLNSSDVELIAGCSKNVAFAAGTLLMREGQPADEFYLIRHGHVAIEVHAPGRGTAIVETMGPGTVVGWSWLVPPYQWTFDARAVDQTAAIAINGVCLRDKARADPAFGFELLSRVSTELLGRLQATRLRLLDLYAPSRGRL